MNKNYIYFDAAEHQKKYHNLTDGFTDSVTEMCDRYGICICQCDTSKGQRDCYSDAAIRSFNMYCLSHIFSGTGRLRLHNQKIDLTLPAGYVVLITPDSPNCFGYLEKPEEYGEDYLFFCGPAIDRMAQNGLLQNSCVHIGEKRFIQNIQRLIQTHDPVDFLKAKQILLELIMKINSEVNKATQYAGIHNIISEIINHPGKNFSIREMADKCHCSTAQFRRNFTAVTGVLPHTYIEGIKMQHAAEYLLNTNDDIELIAGKLGYEDRFYFSRRFRIFFNTPPASYRKNKGIIK